MICNHIDRRSLGWVLLAWIGAGSALAAPLGTAFTYQGELKHNNGIYSGTADLQFALMDSAAAGVQIGGTNTLTGVNVTAGLFTVTLDFGAAAFDGHARWLAISVRVPADSGNYTLLTPRQPLTATPYALNAANGNWPSVGTAITNANAGSFVGVNRSTPFTSAEYFGIQAPVQSGFGGMYIVTDGAAGQPFYGYAAGSGGFAWTYFDGPSSQWRVSAGGIDRINVDSTTGNVGIGTASPLAPLHINGALRVTTGPLIVDGPFGSANSSISAYSTTTGDMLSIWNDATGNAGVFQARSGNAINATIIGGSTGTAVNAVTTGTGRAGLFQITNSGSNAAALEASTNGTGLAGKFTGDVQVNGKLQAHLGASLNRGTPIAYGSFTLDQGSASTLSGSGNVGVAYVGNDTYRINVTGEANPASWIVVANVAYSNPANPDLLFDNIRVGLANASGQVLIYAPCTSGCGTFTSQQFVLNYAIYRP